MWCGHWLQVSGGQIGRGSAAGPQLGAWVRHIWDSEIRKCTFARELSMCHCQKFKFGLRVAWQPSQGGVEIAACRARRFDDKAGNGNVFL